MRRTLLTAVLCCAAVPLLAQDPDGRVYELANVETLPRPTNIDALRTALDAAYPAELRDAGTEGAVVVSLIVSPAGETRDVAVLRSTDAAFESATVKAVRVLRFTPAEVDGKPVAVRVELPIQWMVAADTRVYELAEVDEPPVPSNVEAAARRMAQLYPPWLRAAGQGGTVTVRLHVNAQGAVVDARVKESTHPQLDPPSLHVAGELTFTPARVAGRPVAVWTEVPLEWQTDKAVAEAPQRDTSSGYELSAVEEPPQPLNLAELRRALGQSYPPHLRDTRQTGSVHVHMRVDAEGVVTNVMVAESSDEAFNEPTVQAVRRLRFRPAHVKGRPVAAWVVLPIQWQVSEPVPEIWERNEPYIPLGGQTGPAWRPVP